ncbi:MAG: MerR family transcriptional regulator [Thermodesulfobacteriota bacterium]
MHTVSRLAARFGLSRSTLLYYHREGLLRPTGRSRAGYRLYSEADARRLEQIVTYRRAGLGLREIKRLLDSPGTSLAAILERRLEELNEEIGRLRGQQRFILGLLRSDRLRAHVGVMDVETWTGLLAASGFSEEDMVRWHVEFERHAPDKHQAFLEFLCLPEERIKEIRSWAAAGRPG